MINKKEKYLKNYLNYEKFKKGLIEQQNKFIDLLNKESLNKSQKDISYINPNELINYKNILPNLSQNNINIPPETNNIYKIRLEQAKPALIELSQRKWPNIAICKNILELKGNVKIINNIII